MWVVQWRDELRWLLAIIRWLDMVGLLDIPAPGVFMSGVELFMLPMSGGMLGSGALVDGLLGVVIGGGTVVVVGCELLLPLGMFCCAEAADATRPPRATANKARLIMAIPSGEAVTSPREERS
ncbi:hypothetical protein [Sphingomonas ginkgonis]|nr:hypothetical protein [Sphingomonas ginkgonis]